MCTNYYTLFFNPLGNKIYSKHGCKYIMSAVSETIAS